MEEIELKFEVPADRQAALLAAMQEGEVNELPLQAMYFDTEDDALARHRMALRLRREGGDWVQTLKASTEESMRRLESNVSVSSGDAAQVPTLDPALHEGTPAGKALQQVLDNLAAKGKDATLLVRYETDVQRVSRDIELPDARVEVSFDTGWIVSGDERTPICEVEFELKGGDAEALVALAEEWVSRHGLWLNTVSKAERGSRLANGAAYGPAVKAGDLELDRHDLPAVVWRRVVAHCLEQVCANASEIAAGSPDGEHVHQLRVGIRRLRTALREMSAFNGAVDPAWDVELREVFALLGEHRDRETVLGGIEPLLDAAGAPAASEPAGDDEEQAPSPTRAVQQAGFQSTLLKLLGACVAAADVTGSNEPKDAARSLFAKRLADLHKKVEADRKRFVSLEPELQHRVRKRLKRLRYLAEFAASLWKGGTAKQYLDELRPLQDALGQHHDEVVALAAYREKAVGDVRAAFAAGWLSARLSASASECQRSLRKFADVEPFWKKHH